MIMMKWFYKLFHKVKFLSLGTSLSPFVQNISQLEECRPRPCYYSAQFSLLELLHEVSTQERERGSASERQVIELQFRVSLECNTSL